MLCDEHIRNTFSQGKCSFSNILLLMKLHSPYYLHPIITASTLLGTLCTYLLDVLSPTPWYKKLYLCQFLPDFSHYSLALSQSSDWYKKPPPWLFLLVSLLDSSNLIKAGFLIFFPSLTYFIFYHFHISKNDILLIWAAALASQLVSCFQ